MKLHLPSSLRKALLACLAAVAVALPTTLSSASLGFGALAALALVQQVTMAEFQPTEWEGSGDKYFNDTTPGGQDRDNWDLDTDVHLTGKEYVEWSDTRGFEIVVYGKGSVKTLKLTKTKLGGPAALHQSGDNYLQVDNLWITRAANADNGTANYWTTVPRSGSSHSDRNGQHFFDHVKNFWINDTCFALLDNPFDITNINTNLHLGASQYDDGISTSEYTHVVLWLKKKFETSGYLDVVEDTRIVLQSGTTESVLSVLSVLSVSNMQGSGNLIIGTVRSDQGTLKITGNVDAESGSPYTGVLSFDNVGLTSGVNLLNIELSDDVTFDVKGLKTENEHAGASFTVSGEEGATATVKITNTDDDGGSTAANMQFGEGVTLELAEGAVQTFTGTSSVSKLAGQGTLKIGGGTTTLGTLEDFRGTVDVAAGAMVLFNPGDGETLNLTLSETLGWTFTLAAATESAVGAGLGVEHGTVQYGEVIDAHWQHLSFKATAASAVLEISGALNNVDYIALNDGSGTVKITQGLTGSSGHDHLIVTSGNLEVGGNISGYNTIEVQNRNQVGSMTVTGAVTMNDGGKFNLNYSWAALNLQGGLSGEGALVLTGGGTLTIGGEILHTGSIKVQKTDGHKWARLVLDADASSLVGGVILSGTLWQNEVGTAAEQPYQLVLAGSTGGDSVKGLKKITVNTNGDTTQTGSNVKVTGKWQVGDLDIESGKTLTFDGTGSVTFGNDSVDDSTGAHVGDGSILSLNSGTYSGKLQVAINLGEGDAEATGGKIVLGEGVELQDSLEISLAGDWLGNLSILSEYQLFDGMTAELLGKVTLDSSINESLSARKLQLKLNEQGQLTVLRTADAVLTWSSSDGTWENKGQTKWKLNSDVLEEDNFVNGDNVTFDSSESGVSSTVQLAGDVVAGTITIKGTFSGAGSATSGWTFGTSDSAAKTLTINGGIALDGNTQALFDEHVSVRLDNTQTEGFSITGAGDITFAGDMTGTATGGGKLVIGDDSDATVVRLTKGGANHQLGEVEVKQGSRLVISGFTTGSNFGSWADGSGTVYGDGAVVLAGTVTTSHYGGDASILKRLLSGNYTYDSASDTLTISHTLKDLYIGDPDVDTSASGMTMSFGNGDNTGTMHNSLLTVERLHVSEGAGLIVGNYNFFRFLPATMSGGPSSNTILLAGAGNGSGASHDAALVLTESITIDWDIEMEKNATIGVNSVRTVTVGGLFTVGSDKTFTKNGDGGLNLTKFHGASDSANVGNIVVAKGKLNITGLSEAGDTYLAESVTVTANGVVSDNEPNSVAEFAAGTDFTVGTVAFTGDASGAGPQCTTNAAVRVANGATLTIEELDLTESNGTITGSDSEAGTVDCKIKCNR